MTSDDRGAEIAGRRLPESCGAKIFFGANCPGCGMTRSFIAMSHAEPARAFRLNFAGPLIYLLAWVQIPYRLYILRRRIPPERRPRALRWVGNVAIAAVLGGWVVRLVAGV